MRLFVKSVLLMVALIGLKAQAEIRSIAVSGAAEKTMEPNMITLNLEIWSKSSTAKQAQSLNASEFQKVKKVFDAFKIKKEDITTEGYSLNPEYVYDQKTQQNKMNGFRVVQNIAIFLHKTEEAGSFFDAVSSNAKSNEAGVSINNIQWDSDKRAQVELSGLADAVINARRQAEEIAKAAGVKIKNVLHISHNVRNERPPIPGQVMFAKAMAAEEAPPTEISRGSIKVKVEVQAEFEI